MLARWLALLSLCAVVLAAPARPVQAGLSVCPAITLAQVGNATACLYDTAFGNDSEAVVNRLPGLEDGYFGFKDWVMVDREDEDDRDGRYRFDASDVGDGDMMMLVFKSGSMKQSPSLIAYLVDALAGDWETPFTYDPFPNHPRKGRDVSHISYYVRAGEVPTAPDVVPTSSVAVPEPATLALFGLGVAGLVAVRRARRAG